MKVVIYFPTEDVVGVSQDWRELRLDRVPLAGERISFDDLSLTVRQVTTVVERYDDGAALVRYDVTAS